MNVRFECSTPEDGFYGTKVNERWNGVLGDLYRFEPHFKFFSLVFFKNDWYDKESKGGGRLC